MRILVLGNNFAARKFIEHFEINPLNIVFSTIDGLKSYISLNSIDDIVDFSSANDINLVVVTNNQYYETDELQQKLNDAQISYFAPDFNSVDIILSKVYAKRFMYKNKIPTPRFSIFEKPQSALEYLRNNKGTFVLKADCEGENETCQFVETYLQAQNAINEFFANDNKKIVIEDYIEGKSATIWAISDGYSVQIIGTSAKCDGKIALFEPDFINDSLREKILNEALIPTIDCLVTQECEYVGILGLEVILTSRYDFQALGYKSFFDDLNAEFFTRCYDVHWEDVFESILKGDIFLKYNFQRNENCALTMVKDNDFKFFRTKIRANLKKFIKNEDLDLNLYKKVKTPYRG